MKNLSRVLLSGIFALAGAVEAFSPVINTSSLPIKPVPTELSPYMIDREKIKSFEPIRDITEALEYLETIPKEVKNFNRDSDRTLLARLILGEAEGCSTLEKTAVGYTPVNRLKLKVFGNTLKNVMLRDRQYSAFNKDNSRRELLMNPLAYNPREFLKSLIVAKKILNKEVPDPTKGATHYYNPKLVGQPFWAKKMKQIPLQGMYHNFYRYY